jgi:hypothetical protein
MKTDQTITHFIKGCSILWFLAAIPLFVSAAYVKDANDCPVSYQSQDCLAGLNVCGYTGSVVYCALAATTNAAIPAIDDNTETASYNGVLGGGYVLNCLKDDVTCLPWICQRDAVCYNIHRATQCNASTTEYSCLGCISGYEQCDGDYEDGDGCEVQIGVTAYPGEANAHYDSSCNPECNSGYNDCDSDLGTAGTGCEIHNGDSCTSGGNSGTWSGCSCITTKPHWVAATQTNYSSGDPLLWGQQFGIGLFAQFINSTNFTFNITQGLCLQFPDSSLQCTASVGGTDGNGTPVDLTTYYNQSNITFVSDGTILQSWYSATNTFNFTLNLSGGHSSNIVLPEELGLPQRDIYRVLASDLDERPAVIDKKIVGGMGMSVSSYTANTTPLDQQFRFQLNIGAGDGIVITNNSGTQQVRINATPINWSLYNNTFQVLTSSIDETPDYLDGKILAIEPIEIGQALKTSSPNYIALTIGFNTSQMNSTNFFHFVEPCLINSTQWNITFNVSCLYDLFYTKSEVYNKTESTHSMFSLFHNDTNSSAVITKGYMIYANQYKSGILWTTLPSGAPDQFLVIKGGFPNWTTILYSPPVDLTFYMNGSALNYWTQEADLRSIYYEGRVSVNKPADYNFSLTTRGNLTYGSTVRYGGSSGTGIYGINGILLNDSRCFNFSITAITNVFGNQWRYSWMATQNYDSAGADSGIQICTVPGGPCQTYIFSGQPVQIIVPNDISSIANGTNWDMCYNTTHPFTAVTSTGNTAFYVDNYNNTWANGRLNVNNNLSVGNDTNIIGLLNVDNIKAHGKIGTNVNGNDLNLSCGDSTGMGGCSINFNIVSNHTSSTTIYQPKTVMKITNDTIQFFPEGNAKNTKAQIIINISQKGDVANDNKLSPAITFQTAPFSHNGYIDWNEGNPSNHYMSIGQGKYNTNLTSKIWSEIGFINSSQSTIVFYSNSVGAIGKPYSAYTYKGMFMNDTGLFPLINASQNTYMDLGSKEFVWNDVHFDDYYLHGGGYYLDRNLTDEVLKSNQQEKSDGQRDQKDDRGNFEINGCNLPKDTFINYGKEEKVDKDECAIIGDELGLWTYQLDIQQQKMINEDKDKINELTIRVDSLEHNQELLRKELCEKIIPDSEFCKGG